MIDVSQLCSEIDWGKTTKEGVIVVSVSTVLLVSPEVDFSDFDLELQIAVAAELDQSSAPEAGFTKLTCVGSGPGQTSTIIGCADELGPICCA